MPARCDGGNISLMVPPPFAMPTLPKKPDNVRIEMSVWIFGLSADGICSIVNIVKQIRYSFLLPKVSDSGARNSGPMPSMITNPVVHPITVSEVVFKELAICSIPGVNIDDANGESRDIMAITSTFIILRERDHNLGFSQSVLLKVSKFPLLHPSPPSVCCCCRRGSVSSSLRLRSLSSCVMIGPVMYGEMNYVLNGENRHSLQIRVSSAIGADGVAMTRT